MARMVISSLLFLTLLAGCGGVKTVRTETEAGFQTSQRLPVWINRTNYIEKDYVYSVGHSQPQDSENAAKDEAYANAIKSFILYCKTEASVINRIYEAYSDKGDKPQQTTDIESSKQVFARAFVRNVERVDSYVTTKKKKYTASVLIRVPKSEYERIQNEKETKLSVDIGFFYEENNQLKPLYEGQVLKSGDAYAIYVNPSDTCYLYIFQIDETGKSFRLFPNRDFQTSQNPVIGGKRIWIPNENNVYYLDETTGRERFYIMASRNPIPELEKDEAINIQANELEDLVKFKKMGPAGIRKKVADTIVESGKGAAELKNKLQAESDFWYEMWFVHR